MELLTTRQMAQADSLTIAAGVDEFELICTAARYIADRCLASFPETKEALVLCGPGNNGADGYVTARLLADAGIAVRVVTVTALDKLSGASLRARKRWGREACESTVVQPAAATLVVDAMFGAGLSRALSGVAASWAETLNRSPCPVVAVDVPSGLDADTGEAIGPVVQAAMTVTFFRKKPGHLLYPGRALCGRVYLDDIGITDQVLAEIEPRQYENTPSLWMRHWPRSHAQQHKYQRGHALVFCGPSHATGAARLSAYAALRAGAGLVTLACPSEAVAVVAAQLTAVMVAPWADRSAFEGLLVDSRKNAAVIGPGFGLDAAAMDQVALVVQRMANVVVDADALTVFQSDAKRFHQLLRSACGQIVITPHDGEYNRLFDRRGSRMERAVFASELTHAVVVLKGPDTVIADSDGRVAINTNAPATLATAGSGDVLAGIIAGLLAQGMPPFEAACCAVWMHGECANEFGEGLIAEDLADLLPAVLTRLAHHVQVDASS